ncbi:flippase [Methanobacterium alcaliphilum]|uniref:flippase n=1 Tax=Methanobacterium alcaliphilum TaxID=392018 RepID=UPI00200B6A36|nr:flippase [Methanobacterium alcaliphilum]MCK9152377.1 flippase [Methanobacterium alcaliphilum]
MSTSKGTAKLLRGSTIIMISNLIFRMGGYIYRVLMARLLGPDGYGLVGLTLPFQGIFQILSAGGLPPAIAKYVAQHKALGEDQMARQVVFTSLKLMMFLGITFSLFMFFAGPIIANEFFHKPLLAYPLQAVALITPFSVIVGAFRGAFQGLYKMEYIVATRAVEQIFMIVFAVVLVSVGFYAAGAVIGTGLGFMASAISAVILFKKYLYKYLPKPEPENKFNFRQELGLMANLLKFSIPVIITALSEMAIYDVGVFVIGYFMATKFASYYTTADPIARLPLVISLSVATAVLPAASEAFSLKDKALLETYIVQSYRIVILTVFPICVGIALFSYPLLNLLFGSQYVHGANALTILVMGMAFYSLFMTSSSIAQGIGDPRIPMYVLLGGTAINIVLNVLMVPLFGIEGAAGATTISTFIIMMVVMWKTFQITQIKAPYMAFLKITLASIVMGLGIFLLPQTILGLFLAILIAPLIFLVVFTLIKGFEKRDIRMMRRIGGKIGPFSRIFEKFIKFIEKYST